LQTPAQALVVVRDQFALKGLSDEALKQIRPVYQNAISRLLDQLKSLPEGSLERELWLRTQLSTLVAQSRAIQDRIMQVLPEAQLQAWDHGLKNAEDYLIAGGIQPGQPAATTTLSGVTAGGQSVSVTGNLPGFNIANATEKGFLSPSITRQQIVASLEAKGFETLLQGKPGAAGRNYSLSAVVERIDLVGDVSRQLREGFLLGESSEDIARRISYAFGHVGGRNGGKVWAMTQAVVRTSMAEASQAAHDAFYEANEDLLIPTKSGDKWWWDASNDTRLCQVCAPLDGVKFKERSSPPHAWPAHFSCRCKILPWTATQELLEEEEGPRNGSFLEATPVQYDKRGKRLPPPAGYTGDNAYKRPMKIDGQQQWVRRRDLGKGQTTAGDMLKAANEHSKKLVLGKHTEAFNKLTGPGGQYEKDPQGAVRKLLGEPLPPGSTAPRPVRGPKPKPPAPKPKAAPAGAKAYISENSFALPNTRFTGSDVGEMVDDIINQQPDGNMRKLVDFAKKDGQVLFISETEQGLAKRLGIYGVRDFNKQDVPWALSAEYKTQLQKALGPDVFRDESFHSERLPTLKRMEKEMKEKIARAKESGWDDTISRNTLKNIRKDIKQSNDYLADLPRRYSSHALGSIADGHTSSYTRRVVLTDDSNELLHGAFDRGRKVSAADLRKGISETLSARAGGDVSSRTFDVRRYGGRKESIAYTYTHETGHQVFFRAGSPPPPKLKGNTPTGYAELNTDELFAESWSAYIFDPAGLKQFDKGLYDWVESTLGKAMKNAGRPLN
jgi:hypothetical protein